MTLPEEAQIGSDKPDAEHQSCLGLSERILRVTATGEAKGSRILGFLEAIPPLSQIPDNR